LKTGAPDKGCDFHQLTNPSPCHRQRPRKTKAETVNTYILKFGHKPVLGHDTTINGWSVAKYLASKSLQHPTVPNALILWMNAARSTEMSKQTFNIAGVITQQTAIIGIHLPCSFTAGPIHID